MKDPAKKASEEKRRNFILLFVSIAPAVAWLLYLQTAYVLAHFSSQTGSTLSLHMASASFLAGIFLLGIIAASALKKTNDEPAAPVEERKMNRSKMLGLLGVMISLEFALLMIASWIAVFILNPMQN
jgi:hypothetical protein